MNKLCDQTDCLLYGKTRVKFRGDRVNTDIVFVGESPGRDEEKFGDSFIGRAGELLIATAIKTGLTNYKAFIANSAMCRIIKEELTTKQINSILANCRCHYPRQP